VAILYKYRLVFTETYSWSKIRLTSQTRQVHSVGTYNITYCSLTLRLVRVKYWGHSTQRVKFGKVCNIHRPSRWPITWTNLGNLWHIYGWIGEAAHRKSDEVSEFLLLWRDWGRASIPEPIILAEHGGSLIQEISEFSSTTDDHSPYTWLMMGQETRN